MSPKHSVKNTMTNRSGNAFPLVLRIAFTSSPRARPGGEASKLRHLFLDPVARHSGLSGSQLE